MTNLTTVVGLLLATAVLCGTHRLHAAAAEISAFDVSLHGRLLTVTVVATPLADVLRVIEERADVRVRLRGEASTPVTASFSDLPVDEAIQRLARGYSVCLLYRVPVHGGDAVLREAWIIPTSPGPRGVPDDRHRQATWLAEIQQLGIRRDPVAIAALTRLVSQDDDPVVRAGAARTLSDIHDPAVGAALGNALARDPDPAVRRIAARALGTYAIEEARHALEGASSDPDAAVRKEVLRALGRRAPVPR